MRPDPTSLPLGHALGSLLALTLLVVSSCQVTQPATLQRTPRVHTFQTGDMARGRVGGVRVPRFAIRDLGSPRSALRLTRELSDAGPVATLGTLGGRFSTARAINRAGAVVGESATASGAVHAFLYQDGQVRDLGTLGGSSSAATAINNLGQIVGASATRYDWFSHAFLTRGGPLEDLGTLGGSNSEALGINDAGQIVGWAATSEEVEHAFLYSEGQIRNLGTLGGATSTAQAINSAGDVVGWSAKDDSGVPHGFLYHDGMMLKLDALLPPGSGWRITRPQVIDDAGRIAGIGVFRGQMRAFILQPLGDRL